MIRLVLILVFAALLMPASAALAGAPEETATENGVEAAPQEASTGPEAVRPRAAKRRLTTAERWRGKPYLATEDSLMRARALDKALPPAAAELNRGALGLYSSEDEALRKRAMDKALPIPGNQLLVGGF